MNKHSAFSDHSVAILGDPSGAPTDSQAHEIPMRLSSSGQEIGVGSVDGAEHDRASVRKVNTRGVKQLGFKDPNGDTQSILNLPLNTNTAVWILVVLAIVFLLRQ